MKKSILTLLAFALVFAFVLISNLAVHSYSGNAPEVLISIAKDGSLPTCNSCHGGGPTGKIDRTGGITITKNDGNLYANNIDYNITLSIDTTAVRHGFQLIALDKDENSIGILSDTSADVNVEDDAVHSVTHVSHHNIQNNNDAIFNFNWKAPSSYKGDVTFHMIAVSANGNRQNTGDVVYYDTMTLYYDAAVSVENQFANSINVYPSVLTNKKLHIDGLSGTNHMTVFDIKGNVCGDYELAMPSETVNLGALNSGYFYLHIQNEDGLSAIKKIFVR